MSVRGVPQRWAATVLTWLAAVVLMGCSGEPPPVVVPVGGDRPLVTTVVASKNVARLLPAKPSVIVYVHAPNELMASVRKTVAGFGVRSAPLFDAEAIFGFSDFDLRERDVDLSQPMALLYGAEGLTHAIVGAMEPHELADSPTAVAGRHVALAMPGQPALEAGSPSTALRELPRGAIVVRCDLGASHELLTLGESAVRAWFEGLPAGSAPEQMVEAFFGFLRRENAGLVDAVLELDGSLADLAIHFDGPGHDSAAGRAPESLPTIYDLMARVPVDGPTAVRFAIGAGMRDVLSWLSAPEAEPELASGGAEAGVRYRQAMAELWRWCDGPAAGKVYLSENSGHLLLLAPNTIAGDARRLGAALVRALLDLGFLRDAETRELTPSGAHFDFTTARPDPSRTPQNVVTRTFPSAVADGWLVDLLGREVRVGFGQIDEFAVATLGVRAAEIEALAPAVRAGRQVHPSAGPLLAKVPGEEVLFFVCFDLFDLMAEAVANRPSRFPGSVPSDDLRAPVVQSLSRTGNRYRLGWRYDLGSPDRLARRLANRPR